MFWILCFVAVFVLICIAGKRLRRRWKAAGIAVWVLSIPLTIMVLNVPYLVAKAQFTDANLLGHVEIEIEKGELRLEKKIPYYLLWDAANSHRNYEDCGLKCEGLVRNGYVSVFYETYSLNDILGSKYYYRITTVGDDLGVNVQEIDQPTYQAKYESHINIETDNWLSPLFGFKNNYIISHIDGVFVEVRAELGFRGTNFGPFLSSLDEGPWRINRMAWYEIFEKLNGDVNG